MIYKVISCYYSKQGSEMSKLFCINNFQFVVLWRLHIHSSKSKHFSLFTIILTLVNSPASRVLSEVNTRRKDMSVVSQQHGNIFTSCDCSTVYIVEVDDRNVLLYFCHNTHLESFENHIYLSVSILGNPWCIQVFFFFYILINIVFMNKCLRTSLDNIFSPFFCVCGGGWET